MSQKRTVDYLSPYPASLKSQAQALIAAGKSGEHLLQKYPQAHSLSNEGQLYSYAMSLKNESYCQIWCMGIKPRSCLIDPVLARRP